MNPNAQPMDDLSLEQKRALLAELREKTALNIFPASFAQERLWFLEQLEPGSSVYNLATAVRLSGRLNVNALEQSLNEIVARHESLRTTFTTVNGGPVQVIAPGLEITTPLTDFSELPENEREAAALQAASSEALRSFDLARGPLVRASLLRLEEDKHILVLTTHHIVSDGWSVTVLFKELALLYEAFSSRSPALLPEPPIQYADYVVWQREYLRGDVLEEQLNYWRQHLVGAPTVLDLPADRPRPPVASFRGGLETLGLSESLVEALRTLGRKESATTFMTLLASFNVLLYRFTGQDDILVGSPIANRSQTETEGLIGLFLNNLVLRTRLSAEASFLTILGHVRETALGAYAHPDLPFEKLVEALKPERDLSRMPLFQVFFNLLHPIESEIKLGNLAGQIFSPVVDRSQFDLTLYAEDREKTIELTLAYNSDLFDRARMVEMLSQFKRLLEQIVVEPDRKISSYSLLTAASRQLLPDATIELSEPGQEPITKTFSTQAQAFPKRPAIVQCGEYWTYAELLKKAETIARGLLRDGLRRADVVAVIGLPSFGLVAGMLGVLKSGGVLLTLDRNLPIERQKLMLSEARARHLLCFGGGRDEDDWVLGMDSVIVKRISNSAGELAASAEPQVETLELPEIDPDDPAYLFFTSGTSGVPKGVLGCHKGLSHFLSWQREQFSITPADRAAQLTGLSFDVVLRDIFLPLTSGASLHLPDDALDVTSGRILAWLEREQITLLHTVPALAQTWLNDVPVDIALNSLRWVFIAGETLTDTLVHRWRESFPGAGQLVNLYGPTETTLAKCFYVVPDEPSFGVQPVGQPLPNSQALVLNLSNSLCGIGEPGEIAIRTPFRTLGYINAAAEHAARFIRNPFTHDANDLLYRTGDRGRYRPDGELEILGRLDDQIKIRGVRVEPGEVNAVLGGHPSVAASVVIAARDEHDENVLAAYVVLRKQTVQITLSQLKAYLETQLPAALVPSYFVALEELPLTPNGKVNRQALPELDQSARESVAKYVAPRNPTEEIIAQIWSEVLGVDRVGISDNFFELGGHSLKAARVVARIGAAFQLDLPVRLLFETRTVGALADAVEEHLLSEMEQLSEDEADQLSR